MTKALIFDSGPLINFTINGLIPILEKLKSIFKGDFLITREVKREVYDRPLNIPKFKLSAVRINDLLARKILKLPEDIGISSSVIEKETRALMNEANNMMKIEGHSMFLVSEAEVSCLALSNLLNKKNIENIIAIDERTLRMLCEKPENLASLMSEKLHKKAVIVSKTESFKGFIFIRSSELVYVAYKKNLIELKDPKTLEALLLATKYKGTSITWDEISELKRL